MPRTVAIDEEEQEQQVRIPLRQRVKRYAVKLHFTSPILGSAPANKEVYADYVASKKPGVTAEEIAREVEMIPENLQEAGLTIFRRDPRTGYMIFLAHMIRGFMKSAAEGVTGAKGLTAYKSKIDKWAFVSPDKIVLMRDGKGLTQKEADNQRPLKAMTAQGPRVSLLNSEQLNEGIEVEFTIEVLPLGQKEITKDMLLDWLDYGAWQGISQWRNAGYGRFVYDIQEV
jgi:hypothetical protein